MRILVVGAGAVGGYFGGRLLRSGHDLRFLVRPERAAQLAAHGLVIRSQHGDLHLPSPPAVTAPRLTETCDVVIVACRAYDLEQAVAAFAPAVGPHSTIVPLLQGLRHIEALTRRFGHGRVLGGTAIISATLAADGAIHHQGPEHTLLFGDLDGERTAHVEAVRSALADAGFGARPSDAILQDMWEQWVLAATITALTTLMRAPVGDIVSAGAEQVGLALLHECSRIAAHNGHAPRPQVRERAGASLTGAGARLGASLLDDIERGGPTEAEHIIGDFVRRGRWSTADTLLLPLADAHLRSYEARRARESAAASRPDERLSHTP